MAPKSSFGSKSMRMNNTHIFFWGTMLSNWDQTYHFAGARALELMLPRLEKLKIDIPGPDEPSTRLISRHAFNCGEQYMMACKAWLFDTDSEALTLEAILASTKPMAQKALGRQVQGFKEQVWEPASIEIVVASQIARAEVNADLGLLYKSSGNKTFVEGSPRDRIWGVGLHWQEERIEDERNWKGENRLGKCHGIAREEYRRQEKEKKRRATATASQTLDEEMEASEKLDANKCDLHMPSSTTITAKPELEEVKGAQT